MKVFSDPQGIASASTFTGGSQPGYDPINVSSTAIRISWRSATTEFSSGIELILGNKSELHGIFLHGLNALCAMPTNVLSIGRNVGDYDEIGQIPIIRDPFGRYKAGYYPYDNGFTDTTYDRVRFQLNEVVGGSYYEIGAIYVFGTGLGVDVIRNPAYGSGLEHVEPVIETELVNGARSVVNAGPAYDILQLDFDALRTGSSTETEPERLWRDFRNGDVGIDLEVEDYQFWPMRLQESRVRSLYTSYNWDSVALSLREIVTV